MSVFKCKMCGGDLALIEGQSVAECEYCGTWQTVPSADNEKKLTLFARANRLRVACEFDKAAGIYEAIVADFQEEAEAYWGLVLCKYGIEYVDDPVTGKKIPTCHRSSFDSIMEDSDFEQALENADSAARRVYRAEAKQIEEVRKGIIAVSNNEVPYDIFICYKETDEKGNRTLDSVLGQDIYDALTAKGYRVFFSRITLEDKLGLEYEPYIFAALNSAKIMLAVGTDIEYYNAVWVKNEWSRFLKLMAKDKVKHLIPCYKGIDVYDMPQEFVRLQAQDLGKVGAMQDLLRGIEKILPLKENTLTIVHSAVFHDSKTDALLKRAFMFLEDGDWNSADEYCEKVLDIDPECAEAYLGKLMAELRVHKQDDLKDCAQPFDSANNYQKAMRFADGGLRVVLMGYIDHINERNEQGRLEGIYVRAQKQMGLAKKAAFKEAAQLFDSISHYKDSAVLARKCYESAENAKKDAVYDVAKKIMTGSQLDNYQEAIKRFETIPDWKDSSEQIAICQQKIAEIEAQKERERLAAEAAAKRNKKIAMIVTPIVCAVIVFVIILNAVIIPNNKYNDAVALLEADKYEEAIDAFLQLGGYKDSTDKILKCKYAHAVALMDAGKYEEAIGAFSLLDGYEDSADKIVECQTVILDGEYTVAVSWMDAGNYAGAINAFKALRGYKDSYDKITECETAILDKKYIEAIVLIDAGEYRKAIDAFKELGSYKDSSEKIDSIRAEYKAELLKQASIGDYILFGSYEQDNDTTNGEEDIEWLVLDIRDGKALVISRYALDCQQYDNTQWGGETWETCSLRKWLNSTFLYAIGSENERNLISSVTVQTAPRFHNERSIQTQDKVFLLSIEETEKYFSTDISMKCLPTDYAVAKGAFQHSEIGNNSWWWLRSPGAGNLDAAYVFCDGNVFKDGDDVHFFKSIRPAMWIDLGE